MANILFRCPKCTQVLKVPSSLAKPGDSITCPNCRQEIHIPRDALKKMEGLPAIARARPEELAQEQNRITMVATLFHCPECAQVVKVSPGLAKPGDTVICSYCNREVRVPLDSDKQMLQKGTSTRPGSRPARRLKKAALALIYLFILTAGGLVALRLHTSSAYKDAFNRTIASLSPRYEITYQDFNISLLDLRISVTNIAITPKGYSKPCTISYLVLDGFDAQNKIPHRLNLKAYGVYVPLDKENPGTAWSGLKALGYESITADITFNYTYDMSKRELAVKRLTIRAPDLAEIDIEVVFSQVNETDIEALISNSPAAGYQQWLIRKGRIRYQDDSFMNRFLGYQAQYIGESLAELRAGMIDDISEVIRDEQVYSTRKSLQQFIPFIMNWEYLIITAQPDIALSYADLKEVYYLEGVKGLIPALKLTFSAQRP